MKQGATYLLAIKLDANLEDIAEIIFTLQGDSAVQKRYPYDVSQNDGLFSIPLTQEDTMLLCKSYSRKIEIEAQINYTNLSVSKTSITEIFLRRSLATEIVDGNTPAGISATEVSLEVVGGVLVATVSPEYIKQSVDQYFEENPQLTEDIKASFDDTKQYVDEKAKSASDSAQSAKESQAAAETAKTAAETAQKKTETAASEVKTEKDSALSEICTAKTNAVTEITATANSGVQSVTAAKNAALSAITDSADGYLQSISTSGQSQIEAIGAAGESEIAGIKAAVDKAVKDVSDTGTAYVDSINTAGQTQTKAVNDAGKAQTDSITAVGGAQVSAVNTAGENQLSSIETASTAAQTAIGTAKEDAVSAVQTEGETQVENIRQSAADYESLAIKETVRGESILIEDSAKWPLKALKLFGKSTQNTTTGSQLLPTDGISAELRRITFRLDNGIAEFDTTDFNGTGTLTDFYLFGDAGIYEEVPGITIGTNTLSLSVVSPDDASINNVSFFVVKEENNKIEIGLTPNMDSAFSHNDGDKYRMFFRITNSSIEDNPKKYSLKVTMNKGNTVLPWEPYTGGIPSPNPDYPQEIDSAGDSGQITVSITGDGAETQSLPYPAPNGLPGIPVSSGGNYTDESGQQWVCDEVDFGRGVYVKRVNKESVWDFSIYQESTDTPGRFMTANNFPIGKYRNASYESICNFGKWSSWGNAPQGNTEWIFALSSTYFYVRPPKGSGYTVETLNEYLHGIVSERNPIVFIAQLVTPEEIPLPDFTLSAYAALHTNYPTTTVLTDSGAGMEVEYVADTRNYIGKVLGAMEQRIAALETNAIGG